MTEMLLPTEAQARAMTEIAIEQSAYGVGEPWLARAELVVREIAAMRRPFSSNDVWAAGLTVPSNRRALGAVMRSLQKEKVIVNTGDEVVSRWGHGGTVSVWQPL